ncbi:MAG: hypothetical protein HY674_15270 [Chloroflexi bacterium]|nr:hypothetical protein [Chloroflexota bacterium]
MRKVMMQLLTLSLLAAVAAAAPLQAQTADAAKAPKAEQKAKKSSRAPFQGKLKAVDKTAMTLTIELKDKSRTIKLSPETRFLKAGLPATLADAVVGEPVAGQVIKKDDGTEEAVSVRFGPKPEAKPRKEKGASKKAAQ